MASILSAAIWNEHNMIVVAVLKIYYVKQKHV